MSFLLGIPLDVQLEVYAYLKFEDVINFSISLTPEEEKIFWQGLIKKKHSVLLREATLNDYKYLERYPYNLFNNQKEVEVDFFASFNAYLWERETQSRGELRFWVPVKRYQGRSFQAKTLCGAIYCMMVTYKEKKFSELAAYLGLNYEGNVGRTSSNIYRKGWYSEWREAKHDEIALSFEERLIEGTLPVAMISSSKSTQDILKSAVKSFKSHIKSFPYSEVVHFPEKKTI